VAVTPDGRHFLLLSGGVFYSLLLWLLSSETKEEGAMGTLPYLFGFTYAQATDIVSGYGFYQAGGAGMRKVSTPL
jgi:hypothetical protein